MLHYYIFYKPFNVLSQFSPEGEKSTLADFFKEIPKDIYPVGRLDYDSEGLLLLTNDKALTHRLLDPKFAHQRTYWVQVEGEVTQQAIEQLSSGVLININGKQHKTKPAIAESIKGEPVVPERTPPIRFRKNIPTSWLSLTLTEGKNRQVRRMTAAVGFPTLRLIRYSIGRITIGELQPGQFKKLEPREKDQLFVKNT
ncbi:pseudouridine synthase [Polluticoccus soli]|uniref:pseudouridine synthase n=1 Tax=Polluticoccus soli TaxID=3034150 RepID=UPI0023E2DDAD|nr:pseudouridine synthase [Flavipsychrobacter sp. JY13-12]